MQYIHHWSSQSVHRPKAVTPDFWSATQRNTRSHLQRQSRRQTYLHTKGPQRATAFPSGRPCWRQSVRRPKALPAAMLCVAVAKLVLVGTPCSRNLTTCCTNCCILSSPAWHSTTLNSGQALCCFNYYYHYITTLYSWLCKLSLHNTTLGYVQIGCGQTQDFVSISIHIAATSDSSSVRLHAECWQSMLVEGGVKQAHCACDTNLDVLGMCEKDPYCNVCSIEVQNSKALHKKDHHLTHWCQTSFSRACTLNPMVTKWCWITLQLLQHPSYQATARRQLYTVRTPEEWQHCFSAAWLIQKSTNQPLALLSINPEYVDSK